MIVLKVLFCNKTATFLEFFLIYLLKKYLLNHNLPKNKFTKIPFTNLLKNTAALVYLLISNLLLFVVVFSPPELNYYRSSRGSRHHRRHRHHLLRRQDHLRQEGEEEEGRVSVTFKAGCHITYTHAFSALHFGSTYACFHGHIHEPI